MKINKLRVLFALLTLGSMIVVPAANATVLLSQGKTSTASSFQTGNEVAKGNDGNSSTRWTASAGTYPQWWKVDLGTNYTLGSATINWYNSTGSRAYKYKIEVSTDDSTYSLVTDNTANTTPGTTTDTFSTIVGRYVKVTVTGVNDTGWGAFWECQIFENTAVPPATTLNAPVEGDTQVALSWAASGGATGYDVQRATISGGPYTTIASNWSGTSYTDTGLTNGSGYYYIIRPVNATGEGSPSNQVGATPTNMPSPWLTQDIGAVGALGSASFSSGTYTAVGSGADVGSTADAFRYVYQTATGDCTVIARVATLQNTNALAKAGVMIRDSLAANAINASVVVTPTSGILFQRRTTAGGSTTSTAATGFAAPYWVKIVRVASTNSVTAFRSPDGTTWTQIGTAQTVTMGSTVYIGFPVSSHVAATLCTATFDNVTPGIVAPPAPSGLGATAVSSSQVNLAWTDNSTTETGFRIERKTGAGGTYAEIATVGANVTTYNDATGLSPSTTYYYQVRAYNAGGNSSYSASANATTFVPPPVAPSAVTFTGITSSGLTVGWTDNSSDETGFKVERKTGVGGTYAQVGSTTAANATSLPDSGLATFTQYYYRVKATNAGGDSGYATEMPVTTLDVAPAAPSGLTLGTVASNHVDISWTDNSNGATGNETNFLIERKTGTGGTYAQVGIAAPNATSFSDTSVASGTSTGYYYRVRATNSGGNSAYSNTVGPAATGGTVISTPANPTLTPQDSDKINVTIAVNANDVLVERSTTGVGGTFVQVGTITAGQTVFSDSGLNGYTTYYYRVRATNGGGANNSGFSSNINTKTMIPAPSNLALTVVSKSQTNLTWTDNSTNEAQFAIERKSGSGGTYAQVGTVGANVTSYLNTGLSTDIDYYYRARVPFISGGNPAYDKSQYSNEIHVILLPTPTVTATTVSSSAITVTWPGYASPNEAGFKVERKPDVGGTWTQIGTTAADVLTYADTGLSADTVYQYRVRAYRNAAGNDMGGDGDYSATANASTLLGGGLPSPWVNTDVGTPTAAGSVGYASGTFTVEGAGSDIWSTADSFQYVYQPLSGDGTIIAHAASLEHSDEWAKTGVMIRESTANNSAYAMMGITPGYGHGTFFSYRIGTGGTTTRITPENGVTAPYWVKLVRNGNTFTGYSSSDGTTWASAGSITFTTPMANSVLVGLPVCSHNTLLCRAVLDNVSVTAASVPAVPNAPGSLSVSAISGSQLNLTWADNSTDETAFVIERKTGLGGTYVPIGTTAANATTYSDMGLAAGTYYYRVKASNTGGDSGYSTEYVGTTVGTQISSLLSEGRPATASSTSTASSYSVDKGNNGVTDGAQEVGWAAATDVFANEWWRVDLGAAYPLSRVVMYWGNTRVLQYKIDVSSDDVTYTTAVDKSSNTTATMTTDNFTATARYVKVRVTGATSSSSPKVRFIECRVYKGGGPAAASALTATPDATNPNKMVLGWTDNSGGTAGVKIERKTGSATGSAYAQIATVGAGVTTYTDTGLAAGTSYSYRVLASSSSAGDALDYSPIATATTHTGGSFQRDLYAGITGYVVSDLTSSTAFINHTTSSPGTGTLNTFEAPGNWGDSYGQMISGSIVAPTTGTYTFWISSADGSELWISTDNTAANAVRRAKVDEQAGDNVHQYPGNALKPREWGKHADQQSDGPWALIATPITLTGGNSYYIKALHKHATGTYDHVAVAWAGPGFSRQVLSDNGSPLVQSLTSPTDGATFTEGSNVTINASATAGTGRAITKVEFLLNGDSKVEAKLGEDTSSPYSFTWNSVAAGSYVLTTRAWDDAGVSASSSVKIKVTNSTFGAGAWAERILNGDGTINWTEYTNVAGNYDRRDMVEYRFGPDYVYYHPTPGTFHTLENRSYESGEIGHPYSFGNTDWYSEGGQLVFSPNPSASSDYQSGVSEAINGDIYTYGGSPPYCFISGIQWNRSLEPDHGQQVQDKSVQQPSFIAANGGTVPPPIATIRSKALAGVTGFLIFRNGFITSAGNSPTDSYNSVTAPYAFTQLAAGKVPTAGAVTLNTEFLLVTVWDTINHKGQVAVIAVDGQLRAQQNALINGSHGEYFWGLASRQTVKALKILGYIDLPSSMNAPTAISISNDGAQKDGVGDSSNVGLTAQLDSQAERDTWLNWTGGNNNLYQKTPKSGYAVVASRSENRVTFIDLQPLFEYYRQMYFTTQANYNLTKNQGPASNQWPHTFAYAAAQMPTVVATIAVTNPTALMAGMPQSPNLGGGSTDAYRTNAYIGTMDGHLLVYDIGDLVTTGSTGGPATLVNTVTIGKNPTSIDNTMETYTGGVINCRGDKVIDLTNSTGAITYTLTDSRIQDPIYTAVSHNGRQSYGMDLLHVMDFEGSQIMTYRFGSTTSSSSQPIITPASDETGLTSAAEFTHVDPMPGCPIMFTRMGQN